MVDHLVNSEANKHRIQRIENAFGTAGVPLLKQGRVLLGEGVLNKMCKKKLKPRQFFLFNDILVYGNVVIGSKKFRQYNKQRIIPLEEVKLEGIDDDASLHFGWYICSRAKSFAVYATTEIEKQQWVDHISRAVREHIREGNIRAPHTYAATMVPDSEAKVCMHCKKTQFTFVNRRHHCRKCGLVVCGNCSNQRAIIVDQGDKPQRVCAACAVELKRDGEQRNSIVKEYGSGNNSTIADSPDDSDDGGRYSPSDLSDETGNQTNFYDTNNRNDEDHGQKI
ncbi:pleckstrin homology domain-containing family F member 2-like [Paramacrobiotus metropolitanus]|uniref:pleckstrin homology domain-containing family F member 2-like n=1 Tax=Paramacrobiotus metropolitanus TaxID=2943436 RepID=UPI002445DAF4|nr:pleckstrin homology domain-containing family F member 2-like [Paramacrobiotus metropolitanus]XP_055335176.1 pleckstrin homology domain-containing family F member 2-like [Paramacrobiotus metropolitanus]XP_055335177.1 pleckstrin homology domain-containing family F member 2-like [Paramacrobiotus metropolitanus]XP_055335178.1 pleckstrin homology domain-containing family F member 2-like [Paramacrobiotus metropolitanus]